MPKLRFGIALFALVAASASCTALIDTKKEQCSEDADCAALGDAYGDAFAGSVCKESVCVKPEELAPLGCPVTPASDKPTVKLSFSVSFAAGVPDDPTPFEISACKRLDSTCKSPVGGPIHADNGETIELEVPTGFQGFLQVTNPDTVSSMVFLGQKVQKDTKFWDLSIPTPVDVKLLGIATGGTKVEPSLGALVMIARDCDRNRLAGVVASNSTGGTGYYFSAMAPDNTLMATTEEGAAGFVNVPIGSSILGGTYNGRPLSPTSVESRAEWFSYAEVFQ
ncbi:MAG: hypothetical protein ABJB12_11700 [Pseudomonadota bacterium]